MTVANESQDTLDHDPKLGHSTLSLASYLLFVRRYLVIVNPVSGQGKGLPTFREKVHPILMEAGVKVELLVTERPGHARSMVSSSNLSEIDGIITVGGDGLLYEVVNGLRCRDDSDRISNIPLGIIATGSGNGLARSVAEYSKEDADYLKNPVLSTTLAAARGKVVPVNLMEVELDGRKIYSFLSVGWGLLADIDVESEVLRAIGESRFTIWSFLRLAKLRHYKAQLSYIPCERVSRDELNGTSRTSLRERDPVFIDGEFISVYSTCQSYIGSDLIFAPKAQPGDGLIHLTYMTKDAGRASATQFLLGIDKGAHLSVSGVSYVTVKEFTIRCAGGINGTITIDGERVTGEEIKIKISPRPLHVFAL
ncbi:Sphingosine kinase 1 [Orchesella cincta]|uniref:Sphingosine kinase 1 n=1 Tax=Orchesella cincta TaxID=48709 RepID=A0A1D2MXR0_ORCCI|nr:Sphingosine kinase 1 [Orchesella cincta]